MASNRQKNPYVSPVLRELAADETMGKTAKQNGEGQYIFIAPTKTFKPTGGGTYTGSVHGGGDNAINYDES